jgi:hypothetical protein
MLIITFYIYYLEHLEHILCNSSGFNAVWGLIFVQLGRQVKDFDIVLCNNGKPKHFKVMGLARNLPCLLHSHAPRACVLPEQRCDINIQMHLYGQEFAEQLKQ